MKKRTWILLAGAVGIFAVGAFVTRSSWMGGNASAQGPQRPRAISVEIAKAERKAIPVDVDAIGTVTPISSVALKSRLETTIVAVHFEDGAEEYAKLDSFAKSLPNKHSPIMESWTFPLWHTPAMFAFALACFLAEWGLRRWKGLP